MDAIDPKILVLIIAVMGTVLWYLLRQKDAQQAAQIKNLETQQLAHIANLEAKTKSLENQQLQMIKDLDAKYKAQCEILFTKHDEDAKALSRFELQIAEGHYKKPELDLKFDKLEVSFKNGFDSVGQKLDKLTSVLITHIQKEEGGIK